MNKATGNIDFQTKLFQVKNRYLNLRMAKDICWRIIRLVIVTGLSFLILYPFFIKISMSFMDVNDYYDKTVKYIPKNFTLDNIREAWKQLNYLESGKNTLILSVFCSLIQMMSCTLIAYGFARFKFKGRNVLFSLVIFSLLIPPQTILVSLYMRFRYFDLLNIFGTTGRTGGFNLIDSFWPFVLLSFTGLGLKNGLYIYIMRQFFRGMPKELEEAAYVDGSGAFRTFWQVMLPSAVPMMLTIFLFAFSWQWTDTFYTGLFFNRLKVLATAIFNIRDDKGIDPVIISAWRNTAVMLVITPLILVYSFAQKYFVQGIERSGIVG